MIPDTLILSTFRFLKEDMGNALIKLNNSSKKNMKTKIIWRLKESPTSENLRELVKDKILTIDEAREMLFSSETEEDRDKKSLESEIKFLREVVEKLASERSQIVKIIEVVQSPYIRYNWYNSYRTWCGNDTGASITPGYSVGVSVLTNTTTSSFSNIKTF